MHAPDSAPAFHPHVLRRIVADPAALDAIAGPQVLRVAADEVLVLSAEPVAIADPHAIDALDCWATALLDEEPALRSLAALTTWRLDGPRPALLQGMAAGVPIKVHLPDDGSARVLVATPYVAELRERWR